MVKSYSQHLDVKTGNLEKVVLHGLNYEVLAVVVLLQQRLTVNLFTTILELRWKFPQDDLVDEIILAEQGKPDVLHEGGKVLCPSFHRVLNPGDNALKHLNMFWLCRCLEGKAESPPFPHLEQ